MTRLSVPQPRLDHALMATAVVLAALAVWPWLPVGAPSRLPPQAPETPAPTAALTLPPLAGFTALVERPLFTPSRRASAADKQALLAGFGRYRLLGLVAVGPQRRALMAEGPRVVELKEGDTLEGWMIQRIEQDRLVLSSASGEAVLTLRQAAAAPAEKPGR